jgi:hypothetical protein
VQLFLDNAAGVGMNHCSHEHNYFFVVSAIGSANLSLRRTLRLQQKNEQVQFVILKRFLVASHACTALSTGNNSQFYQGKV